MVSPRTGRWDLLGHDSDPVPPAETDLDPVVKHYRDVAEAMTTQARLLASLADGGDDELKGQAADAMRKRAADGKDSLAKAAGRYVDVRDAITAYQPAVGTARAATQGALDDAVSADDRLRAAQTLTDEDEKKQKTDEANRDLDAAKAKLTAALDALRTAAETASARIKKNWGSDGLHTTVGEAIAYIFNKFVKVLVEVLGYIGMLLTVLAVFCPGVGWLAWAAMGVGMVSLAGSAYLYHIGQGSLLNVVLGVVGVVGGGLDLAATKIVDKIAEAGGKVVRPGLAGFKKGAGFVVRNDGIILSKQAIGTVTSITKNAGWLQFKSWGMFWSKTGAIGLSGLLSIARLSKFGISGEKLAEGAGFSGWLAGILTGLWSLVGPSDIASIAGLDDARSGWTDYVDWNYLNLQKG